MSVSLAFAPSQPATAAQTVIAPPLGRDLRLDFFRGLALLMIFIDHVSGNRFALVTLQSLGFADAAEMFVLIAGMAGVYAYRKKFHRDGLQAGTAAILGRIRTLYLAHLAMVVGVLLLAGAATAAGTGFDIVRKLGLDPFLSDPTRAALLAPFLAYLPHYLDILPLYVVLLAALPLVIMGFRTSLYLPLMMAMILYGVAQTVDINPPSFGSENGWFLNPFAWGVLFVAGATLAELRIRGELARLPRGVSKMVTLAALAFVIFAFLHAAPWRSFPSLEPIVPMPFMFEPDKTNLGALRLMDILAKAWLVAVLVPATAAFMAHGAGGAISRAGRNSLPLFVAGTFLSLLGSIALFEAQGHALAHIGITAGGVYALLALAWLIEKMPRVAGTSPASALKAVR